MRLIRAALSIGFSVRELYEIFRERESGAAPCRRVRELAAEKLDNVEVRLRELQSCRRELRKTLRNGTAFWPRRRVASKPDCWKRLPQLTRRAVLEDLFSECSLTAKRKRRNKYENDSGLGAVFDRGYPSSNAQQTSSDQKLLTQDSHVSCPMHDAHAKMNERGEKGMGFSQTDTIHHFFLNSSGGVIQVEAKDSADVSDEPIFAST